MKCVRALQQSFIYLYAATCIMSVSTGRQVSPVRVFTAFMHRRSTIVLATTPYHSFYHSQCHLFHPENAKPPHTKSSKLW